VTFLWLAGLARAAVEVETPPVEGTETVIHVTDSMGDADAGETVRVVHRPGLAGERELAIGITDGRGRVRWRPEQGGIALIRAGDQTSMLQIQRSRVPTTTLVVLALLAAGGLLPTIYGMLGRRGR
jgi:hypothetical protein